MSIERTHNEIQGHQEPYSYTGEQTRDIGGKVTSPGSGAFIGKVVISDEGAVQGQLTEPGRDTTKQTFTIPIGAEGYVAKAIDKDTNSPAAGFQDAIVQVERRPENDVIPAVAPESQGTVREVALDDHAALGTQLLPGNADGEPESEVQPAGTPVKTAPPETIVLDLLSEDPGVTEEHSDVTDADTTTAAAQGDLHETALPKTIVLDLQNEDSGVTEVRSGIIDANTTTATAQGAPHTRSEFESELVKNGTDLTARMMKQFGGILGPEGVQDLVQTVYAHALRSYETFASGTNMHAWLNRIGFNEFVNTYRQTKNVSIISGPMADDIHDSLIDPTVLSVHELAVRNNQVPLGVKLSAIMPLEFAQATGAAHGLEMEYQDVANKQSVEIGTVKSRVHRGKEFILEAAGVQKNKEGTGDDAKTIHRKVTTLMDLLNGDRTALFRKAGISEEDQETPSKVRSKLGIWMNATRPWEENTA